MPQKVSFDMPRPLLPRLEACAPYPVDALGEVLGDAANAIISAVQVPDALAAQSVLAAAAMAAQPHANVVRGGQEIPLSIFCLSVGDSGFWAARPSLTHENQCLRYPVFVKDYDYRGSPDMTKHPLLRKYLL
ncbi:DUF3987 domain-containing protein [Stutzerimonas balearica]|jgi:hypothetical protein|uniref:DUF3987 domain-containing protein n=1 Tax=Stutzerimonas balearica TaxID=74829 RepID=UPI000AB04C74